MQHLTNKQSITERFSSFLSLSNTSSVTIKNYISDLNYFAYWIISNITSAGASAASLDDSFPYFSFSILQEYKNHLIKSSPTATTNRRLSSIRKFFEFLFDQGIISENYAKTSLTYPQF